MKLLRKTNIREFDCVMCKKYCLGQNQYILKTYGMLPEIPPEELGVCVKCVIRETIFKKKKDIDEYLLGS